MRPLTSSKTVVPTLPSCPQCGLENTYADGALWISGDTVLFDGLDEVVGRVQVDVAVLHLGGVRFPISGPLRYTMTADEGLELCRRLRPSLAIPVHYEGWSHFRDPATALRRPGGTPVSFG